MRLLKWPLKEKKKSMTMSYLGSDRDMVKQGIIRQLDESHSAGGEDPWIQPARLENDAL